MSRSPTRRQPPRAPECAASSGVHRGSRGGLAATVLPGEPGTMASMTDPDLRAAFAAMTKALIPAFRATGRQVTRGPFAGRPVLLLTTKGAKSGQPRLAPVVYSRDGEHYVIVASKAGSPTHPAWYHNLLAHPAVTAEVGGETFT